jgi:hypothetical protein
VEIETVETGDPEGGVAGDAVDGGGWAGTFRHQTTEGVFDEEVVGEDSGDDTAGDVEVACPTAPISFDGVPDAVLHAEVGCVGTDLPDAVEQDVGGFEVAGVRDGIVDTLDANGLERGE